MIIIDRYLDKWLCKKALGILTHKLVMCGFRTQIIEKSTYYDIKIQKIHSEKKPVYFFTLYIIDGLEFYIKWYNEPFESFVKWAEETIKG